MIGCVGDDDFGVLNVERLRSDGVDVSGIAVLKDATTGSAFVTYREDGDRDFIYNITNSASAQLSVANLRDDLLAKCGNFHVMGSSLFSFRIIEAMKQAIETVKTNGGTVSFDPNIRKEMLRIPEMRDALDFILDYTDVFLPSGHEVTLLASATSERGAIDELLKRGVKEVVVKRGAEGCSFFDANGETHRPAFKVAGTRSHRRGRLLRRDVYQLPRARHGRGRRVEIRVRKRRARGRRERPDGRHGDVRRTRRVSATQPRSKVMNSIVSRLSNAHPASAWLAGIYSICSAHPWVLEAAMRQALEDETPLLIESTSNQVDQYGGYTGMKPADFVDFVRSIAERVGFPHEHLILGGDHLGPNAWRISRPKKRCNAPMR